jgi:hypothetical protein
MQTDSFGIFVSYSLSLKHGFWGEMEKLAPEQAQLSRIKENAFLRAFSHLGKRAYSGLLG